MENISGILMDYLGTVDTNGEHWFEVMCNMYEKSNIKVDKEELRKAYIFAEQELEAADIIKPTNTFKDVMQLKINFQITYMVQHNMIEMLTPKRVDTLVDNCYTFARHMTQMQAPILERLSQHYPLILVSNFYGNIHSVLKDFGISKYFRGVIESAVEGVRKPDPALYRLGIERLHAPAKKVVVIGDSYVKDIAPAKKLGCQTIWLQGNGWDDVPDSHLTADHIIKSLDEVIELLGLC